VVSGPDNITVPEGTDVEITCMTMGMPQPTASWFKAGTAIEIGKTYQIDTTTDSATLVIKEAQLEHSDTYTLKLENPAGEDSYNVKVTVTGMLLVDPDKNSIVTFRICTIFV